MQDGSRGLPSQSPSRQGLYDPALGKGFMHESQGWGLFLVSLLILAAITFVVRLVEDRVVARWGKHA